MLRPNCFFFIDRISPPAPPFPDFGSVVVVFRRFPSLVHEVPSTSSVADCVFSRGGSLAFTCPDLNLSFVMMVNKLSKEAAATTEAVVQLVCDHYGLGTFVTE